MSCCDKNDAGGQGMNDLARMDLCRLHVSGIPFGDLPEDPPRRDGYKLFALITNDNSLEFAVAVGDPDDYRVYREKTKRPNDRGSYIFRKMELFFVPEDQLRPDRA